MHRQLQAVARTLRDAQDRLDRLVAATPDSKWGVRSANDSWSVAECIAHLNLTSRAMVPLLLDGVAAARAIGGGAPVKFRRNLLGFIISSTQGPLFRLGNFRFGRVKTAPAFVPGGDMPRDRLAQEFRDWTKAELALLDASDGVPLDRARMESPFVKGAMYDPYSGFLTLANHKHRHLDQAERVWKL